ncbi:M24 family metallopeptidase [Massilibacterium senegalense]|uniref:M24 family metallopeptidase n=1 Tax=Massilibacterium senegalense TaxID=1632858 RepID=UPI0007845593|nr:Xaa-Pro peptidase family protein [Massilibacterium senegalense]
MDRLQALRKEMDKKGIDALLITGIENRRYVTGFTGSSGVAFVTDKHALLITDFRYIEQATVQAPSFEIVKHTGPMTEEVAKQVQRLAVKKVAFERDHMTYALYEMYQKVLPAELVPVHGLVENLRLIKDSEEIKIIKEAAKIADASFHHILTFIRPGIKEIDIATELEYVMRKQGASSSSFDTIVASGVRSSLPHGVASHKIIEHGDIITLDFGAYYQGYCSDITRTIAVGSVDSKLQEIYHIVLEAQIKGIQGIKPGITGKEADAITRDYITSKGYGENFGHSTGHGIGLEIHEGPALSVRSDIILQPGMVVTCEPGIYVEGFGGVRIEDDLLITEQGNEVLTTAPKELIILDA